MSCGGKPKLAGRRVTRGNAIIAALEHGGRSLMNVLNAALHGAGAAKLRVRIVTRLDLDDVEQVDDLLAEAQRTKTRVIVIDPFRASTRADENSADQVRNYGHALRRLTDGGRRLVILIHHLWKDRRHATWLNGLPGTRLMVGFASARRRAIMTLHVTHHGAPAVSRSSCKPCWDDDKLTLEEIATPPGKPDAGEPFDDALKDTIVEIITASPGATMRKIREGVRAKKIVHAGNDAIDAAVDELAAEKTIENRGTGSRHSWFACNDPSA